MENFMQLRNFMIFFAFVSMCIRVRLQSLGGRRRLQKAKKTLRSFPVGIAAILGRQHRLLNADHKCMFHDFVFQHLLFSTTFVSASESNGIGFVYLITCGSQHYVGQVGQVRTRNRKQANHGPLMRFHEHLTYFWRVAGDDFGSKNTEARGTIRNNR